MPIHWPQKHTNFLSEKRQKTISSFEFFGFSINMQSWESALNNEDSVVVYFIQQTNV